MTGDPFGVAGEILVGHARLTKQRQHDLRALSIGDCAQRNMDLLSVPPSR